MMAHPVHVRCAVGFVQQKLFSNDMKAIRRMLAFASPKHLFTLSQLEKQLVLECDYRIEASALQEVANNMTQHGFMPREVVVPRPMQELTTGRVLVMELLDGVKLTEAIQRTSEARKAEGQTRGGIKSELVSRGFGNAVALTYITMMRWCSDVYNQAAWLLSGVTHPDSDTAAAAAMVARVVDILMRVHGAQLLRDGLFNADPNGGNFLLLRDGRIGLLDFGATKRLTREERLLGAVSAAMMSCCEIH